MKEMVGRRSATVPLLYTDIFSCSFSQFLASLDPCFLLSHSLLCIFLYPAHFPFSTYLSWTWENLALENFIWKIYLWRKKLFVQRASPHLIQHAKGGCPGVNFCEESLNALRDQDPELGEHEAYFSEKLISILSNYELLAGCSKNLTI